MPMDRQPDDVDREDLPDCLDYENHSDFQYLTDAEKSKWEALKDRSDKLAADLHDIAEDLEDLQAKARCRAEAT